MNAQNLSTVMGPNILYAKNNEPTSRTPPSPILILALILDECYFNELSLMFLFQLAGYFDVVMAESQTFTFILENCLQLFPTFDAPTFISPKDQKVPPGVGTLPFFLLLHLRPYSLNIIKFW